ncbi:F-box/kelch-repeat protein At3g23880-like [Coffea eugenioides]|uniref:F-box/kelch-repeat protein At3g23880-like n=1 Tax=Coffea eugenioides TaxID=49369 RepID=UPI000F615ACD|nr:F-box/kelch-repeat protein At3g23880-like [Coffea eugenioides]
MESKGNGATNPHQSEDSNQPLILPDLPFEVITEILLRLPVKSLLKFKCVSKSWLSLISSSQFIKDHLCAFSSSEDGEQLQLLTVGIDLTDCYLKDCSLASLLHEGQPANAAEVEIDCPPSLRLSRYFNVVGCCDGLFCIDCMRTGVFLWNPSTRKSKKLPSFSSPTVDLLKEEDYYQVYGFGYDKDRDDYKVVKVVCSLDEDYRPSGSEVLVYSVKTESWKSIGEFQGGFPSVGGCGCLVNGRLHWELHNAGWDFKVVFLDLATETFGSLDLALKTNGGTGISGRNGFRSDLGTFGASLCFVCKNYRDHFVELWVMKEYGVGESWTKVLSVPVDKTRLVFRALCIPGSDRFLVELKDELRLYDPKDDSFRLLPWSGNHTVPRIFVQSLVSPNPNAAAEMHQQH